MKTTRNVFTLGLLIFSLLCTSCSKDGDTGPIGPAGISGIDGTDGTDGNDGADGTAGEDGTDGVDGNADVRLLEFGTKTFIGSTSYLMEGISVSDINTNLFIAFYGREFTEVAPNGGILEKTQWIPVPGKGENGLFETNAVIEGSSTAFNSDFIVSLYNLDGTPHTTARSFRKFKILIVPPSSLSGKSSNSDFSKMSYETLVALLGFEE